MKIKFFSILIILSLVLIACGPLTALFGQSPEEPIGDLDQEVFVGDEADSEALEIPVVPLISSLTADADIVGPGSTLRFSGHPSLSGELTFTQQDEIIARTNFDQGSGELLIPEGTPDGRYLAIVESEAGELAYTQVRVSSGPGVWLAVDRQFATERDLFELVISSYGLPDDLAVFIGIGDIDWEEELFGWDDDLFDDEDDDWFDLQEEGVTQPTLLVPMANGLLVPSHTPELSLGQISDLTLLLPAFLATRIQVITFESNGLFDGLDDDWDDNDWDDDDWDDDDWDDDDWDDDDWDPWDTDFEPVDYWVTDPIYLQLCDQVSQVRGDLGGSGWVQVWSLDGELISQGMVTESGEFSFEVKPGATLVLAGINEDDDPLPDIHSLLVDIPCSGVADVDVLQGSWELGSMPAVSASTNSEPAQDSDWFDSIQPVSYLGSVPLAPSGALQGQAGGGGEICRQVAVAPFYFQDRNLGITTQVAAHLNHVLSRANVFSAEAVKGLAGAGASVPPMDFQIISNPDSNRPLYYHVGAEPRRPTDAFVHVFGESPSPVVMARYIMDNLIPQLGQRMADAAICGEINPARFDLAKGEEREFTIHLTNINNVGISDADFDEPELECGEAEFHSNTGTFGLYRLTYKAEESLCTDELVYTANWGRVKSEEIQSRAEVFGSYLMQGNRQLELLFYTMETGIEARACDAPLTGPWEGELMVQPDPGLVSFIGLAGAFSHFVGLEGEGDRVMELAPQLLELGALAVNFNMPEDGGFFPIFGGFEGHYYPDLMTVVVFVSAEYLFIADITPMRSCE